MSDDDPRVRKLEARIAHLEGKLASINPDDVHRAKWTHEQITELMKPFSDLRNTTTLIDQMQHCISLQEMQAAELRAVKLMLGAQVAEEMEADATAHLVAALEAAGKADFEIEAIVDRMNKA